MKKKSILIIISIIIVVAFIGIITKYIDSGRVATNNEPRYCIKIVNNDGSKVTYLGLGYKVIRYVGVSPNEPYKNNIGVKMGNWFMKYELPENEKIEIELLFENKMIQVTNIKDIGFIENVLVNSKYNNEVCRGINTYKIILDNDIYYIKEDCKEIQKGNKQAEITDEDLKTIKNIISKSLENFKTTNNVKIEVLKDTITPSDVSIIITDNNEKPYGWGVEFRVQEKINGEWKDLKYISDEVNWIAIGYLPNADKQIKKKLDIEQYYGKLPNGIYRIVKPVYDGSYMDLYSNEFEIK